MGLRRWTLRTIELLAVLVAVTPAYAATITVPANGSLSGFGTPDPTRGMIFTLPTPGIGNELSVYFSQRPTWSPSSLRSQKSIPQNHPLGSGKCSSRAIRLLCHSA